MSHIDLECGGGGHRRSSSDGSDGDTISDEGSCYSRFYSTADGSNDDYNFGCGSDLENGGGSESRRVSSAAESDCSENGFGEIKVHLDKLERDCRICHLSLESVNAETGIAIELGCSCKEDLAAAHRNCAEAWFKIKGNKTCEICNSVARNVLNAHEIELIQQQTNVNVTSTNAVSVPNPPPAAAETRRCLNGHRLVNLLLACMVCAFVISWLFHFNIPS